MKRSLGFNRILRSACLTTVMLAALFLALISLNWCYLFHPRNMTGVWDPVGKSNRAFTEVGGFVDVSVDLYASDWPWTLGRPAYLGDFYWPEIQKSSAAYWSIDGSVLAFQTHRNEDDSLMFRSAYDYQKHELIKPDQIVNGSAECHSRILSLLQARGGTGPQETRMGDFKGYRGEGSFPAWGWVAPAAFLAGGMMMVMIVSRKWQGWRSESR